MNRPARMIALLVGAIALATLGGCLNLIAKAPVRTSMAHEFTPSHVERLVVIAEDGTGRFRNRAVLRQVEDEFARHLLSKGYRVAARTDLRAVEDEIRLQRTEMTAQDAATIGRILNVDGVIVVTVTQASTTSESRSRLSYTSSGRTRTERYRVHVGHGALSARLIDLNSDVLWVGSSEGRRDLPSREQIEHVLTSVAGTVAAAFPGRQMESDIHRQDM